MRQSPISGGSGSNDFSSSRSVNEVRGLALDSISETTDVLERDTVGCPRSLREKCIGCGRCAVSCADGGHQAIRLTEDRRPLLDGSKCVGCHLCVLVCPQRAIVSGRKRIAKPKPPEEREN